LIEELIHDRISFRKFLDIKDEDNIPDETTICKFRKKLVDHNLFETIFIEVKNMMNEKNLILNTGTLVDATLIHSSEPKRKRDKDEQCIT
jgi:IS5 family transposase